MRIRTTVVVGILILILAGMIHLVTENRILLQTPFYIGHMKLPIYVILIIACLFSFLFLIVSIAVNGFSKWLKSFIDRFQSKYQNKVEEYYLKGTEAAIGGRLIEAIHHLERAIDVEPEHYPTLLKLGEVLRLSGNTKEAIARHKSALSIRPNEPSLLYALADDYIAAKDHEEAKKILGILVEANPKRALRAYRTLRTLYMEENNWALALEIQKRIDDARVIEEEKAEDVDFRVGLSYQVAVEHLNQGKTQQALKELESLKKIYPTFTPIYPRLSYIYQRLNKEKTAISILIDGYANTKATICLQELETLLLNKEKPEEAVETYEKLSDNAQDDIIPRFLLGRLYYRLEILEKAEVIFDEVAGRVTHSGLLFYYIGRIFERQGNMHEACKKYRQVIKSLNPFEVSYRCTNCHELSPTYKDLCASCGRWNTYKTTFKDELLKAIEETVSPSVYYQGTPT